MFRHVLFTSSVAAALAMPTLVLAQSDTIATRAQITAQLAELERAGYDPRWDHWTYPHGLQAAQARVDSTGAASRNSYGTSPASNFEVGKRNSFAPRGDGIYDGR